MSKDSGLSAADIQPLIPGMGASTAADMVTVEGDRVSYMAREEPKNEADKG